MNRTKKTFPFFLLEIGALIASFLLLFSCVEDSFDLPQENRKLIKETRYSTDTASSPTGSTSYKYDNRGNLILKAVNVNNEVVYQEKYEFDARNRLILESVKREAEFFVRKSIEYPSEFEKTETLFQFNGDTLNKTFYFYNDFKKPLKEVSYHRPYAYGADKTSLFLASEKNYNYDESGSLYSSVEKSYVYLYNGERDTITYNALYDSYGNKVKLNASRKGSVYGEGWVSEENWVYNYKNGLLFESYQDSEFGKEYSYIRYVYDELGRKIRTYDFNNYLTGEWFYEGSYLVKSHLYTPDGYDNIPDYKMITIYTYE